MRWLMCLALGFLGLLAGSGALPAHAQQTGASAVAIIVHPDNPTRDMTLEDLRRLYLGRAGGSEGAPTLMEHVEVREAFYQGVLGWSPYRARQHWIGLIFEGLAPSPPVGEENGPALVSAVASDPRAVAFVAAYAVDESVRIVSIDGLRPGDPGYALR